MQEGGGDNNKMVTLQYQSLWKDLPYLKPLFIRPDGHTLSLLLNLIQCDMLFPDKTTISRNGYYSRGYASQAVEAMRLIHNSFVIMTDKLKLALKKKAITDKEYDDWMDCFRLLQEDWLGREINTADDVLFLQWMARSSMEKAKYFVVAGLK